MKGLIRIRCYKGGSDKVLRQLSGGSDTASLGMWRNSAFALYCCELIEIRGIRREG